MRYFNMKHLLLYEAFDSKTLSSIANHLKKQISKEAYEQFITKLKDYQGLFDLPLSSISEDCLKYMSSKKAIQLKPDNEIHNPYGIWAIKFWFDIEKGFIMETGIGNKSIPLHSTNKNALFNEEELNFLKQSRNIKTGNIRPVTNYSSLRHGDKVIGYFTENLRTNKLALATIWRKENYIYAIQGVSQGTNPSDDWSDDDMNEDQRDWRNWGQYGWNICNSLNSIHNDHKKLHHYTYSQNELSYTDDILNNVWDNNLPLDIRGQLISWKEKNSKLEEVKDSDYCVVLFLDQLLVDYDSLEDIRDKRIASRANATKLLSDDEIRKININRYLEKLGSFQDEKGNLVNLQKFILYTTYGRHAFYSIFNYECLRYIELFMYSLDSLIKSDNKNSVKSIFKKVYENNDKRININKGISIVKTRIKNDKVQYVISVIEQIDRIIYDYIKGLNIDNINDLEFVYHKLSAISNIIHSNRFRLYSFRNVLAKLDNPDMIIRNYIRKGYWNDEVLDKDITKINNIKRYIESLCK